jgi:hypothetical protein
VSDDKTTAMTDCPEWPRCGCGGQPCKRAAKPAMEPETTADPDLAECVRQFIRWIAANDFTDPENMLVCAEWFNLCGAVDEPMRMAGEIYRQKNAETANGR